MFVQSLLVLSTQSVLIQRPSVSSVYEVNGTETDWFVVNGHWSYVANEHTTILAC